MKKTFFFTILALLALTMQAQRFEWVKAYSSPGGSSDPEIPSNIIKGSVVDRDGNIYVLGDYFPSATAMPFGVYPVPTDMGVSLTTVNRSIVIAKLNPDGELLWYKGLHSVRSGYTGDGSIYSHGIRLIGDTAVMVCAIVRFPFENYNHDELWYLDTLLVDQYQHWGEIPTSNDYACCFMTLNLDGKLIEDHILEWCAADENGDLIHLSGDTNYVEASHVEPLVFDVDADGNIYLLSQASQNYAQHPTAAKLGYIIDKRHIVYYRDGHNNLMAGRWNKEIVKFSPHFDTVLNAIYLFDSTSNSSGAGINETSFRFDRDNNLYLSLYQAGGPTRLPLGNSDTIVLTYDTQAEHGNCFLVKYNTDLVPQWAKQTHSSQGGRVKRNFHSRTVEFDYATNSLYWTGWVQKRSLTELDGNSDIAIFYGDDTLDLDNNFFWLRLDRDNGRLISYGKARSNFATEGMTRDEDPRIVVAKGKVAAMFNYIQDVTFADTTISQTGREENGAYSSYTALAIWDEDGNELAIHDLNAMGSYNRPGAVYAHDSILYITCSLTNGATFGDIEVPSSGGRSQAILAKYVNPIFSTGGHTPGTEGIDDTQTLTQSSNQAITIYPNPASGYAVVTCDTPIHELTLRDINGRLIRTLRNCGTATTLDTSTLTPGLYTLQVTTDAGAVTRKLAVK